MTVRVDVLVTVEIERNGMFDDPGDQAEHAIESALAAWSDVEIIAVEAGDWSESP